ncbi:MAG: capsule biosynthesis protein, partial [Prevotellaceae bacterium]|nr:capsule biosynthesis protein [Prevotellaceae bacterium]
VRYDRTFSFRDYIDNSGGFSPTSYKRKSYVVYANGTSKSTKRFLFFRSYPEITPGSKIYVPVKPEKTSGGMTLGEGIALTSSLITLTALVVNLIRK